MKSGNLGEGIIVSTPGRKHVFKETRVVWKRNHNIPVRTGNLRGAPGEGGV